MRKYTLIAFALLIPIFAYAQDKPRTVEPIRVSIATETEAASPEDREFNELLRAELNRRGNVAFTSRRFDCKVLTATTRITERGTLTGYAVAAAIMTPQGDSRTDFHVTLHVETGPSLADIARHVLLVIDKEVLQSRRPVAE